MLHRSLEVLRHAVAVVVKVAKPQLRVDVALLRRPPVHLLRALSERLALKPEERAVLHEALVEQEGHVRLRNLVAALCERRVDMERRGGRAILQRLERVRESAAPLPPLGHRLEKLHRDRAGASRADAVEVHLPEVVQRDRVALVCGERKVVQRLVVCLLHAHARDVHGAQVELRFCVALLSSRLEMLERLLRVLRDAVSVHVHVTKAVKGPRVALGGALAKELERGGVVLLDADALRVHVAEMRERGRFARRRRVAVQLEGALHVHGDAARAVVMQVRQRHLRVHRALPRRVLVVLDDLVVGRAVLAVAERVVDAQAHLLDQAAALDLLGSGNDLLCNRVVVHQCLGALFGHLHAKQLPVAERQLRADGAALSSEVVVGQRQRHVHLDAEPRRVEHAQVELRLRLAHGRRLLEKLLRLSHIARSARSPQEQLPGFKCRTCRHSLRHLLCARMCRCDASQEGQSVHWLFSTILAIPEGTSSSQ
mmetsp:Transcript_8340/g.18216  ORF Transcript_8340/g.18216 Transcript_8340/m.18216 type:complete len:483 (+) Transcript_8340:208-1656(+)